MKKIIFALIVAVGLIGLLERTQAAPTPVPKVAPTPVPKVAPPAFTNTFRDGSGFEFKTVTSTKVGHGYAPTYANSFVVPKEWTLISTPTPFFRLLGENGQALSHVFYYQDAQSNTFCVTIYGQYNGSKSQNPAYPLHYEVLAIKQAR
jgi:hypothetical protein